MKFFFLKNHFSSSFVGGIIITLTITIIYSNIYHSPFAFDDIDNIKENVVIRDLRNFSSFERLLKPRAIVDLTLAFNYRFGGFDVYGYHLVNVLIHMLNGFLVYFLALRVFGRLSGISTSPEGENSRLLNTQFSLMSLLAALIFVSHPIQTQAVTYIIQRYASMATMFYLASILFYIKARILAQKLKFKVREAGDDGITKVSAFSFQLSALYFLSIFCGILAFLSKQNAASLPGAILLVEYLFVDRTWQGWKKKIPWFFVFFTLWILFVSYGAKVFSGGVEGRGWLEEVSARTRDMEAPGRWRYLCTQFNVLVIYIRLLFLPLQQNLDYLYQFKKGFFDGYIPLAFSFLVVLIVQGVFCIKKSPVISISIIWFFITLSVESSIIPIRDTLFEHRLYLPMFGFSIGVAYEIFIFLSNRRLEAIAISISIILCLGTATYLRNRVWQDEITLWSDVVSNNPKNPRGHFNLGNAFERRERIKEAIYHYYEALRIKPDYQEVHNNLGNALVKKGKHEEALLHYIEALRIKPDYADPHYNLGNVFKLKGSFKEAINQYFEALRIKPDYAEAHLNLGTVFQSQGKFEEATNQYFEALRIKHDYAEAHNNIGVVMKHQGRFQGAINHYQMALRINPDYVEAYNNLGVVLEDQGKSQEAIRYYNIALGIKADYADAHNNLGSSLLKQGKYKEAIGHYSEALRINPDLFETHYNMGSVLDKQGKSEEAIRHYTEAIRLKPDLIEAHYKLGNVFARQQKIREAVDHYSEVLRLKSDYAEAHNNLGVVLERTGRINEAIHHYSEALRIKPEYTFARKNLEVLLQLIRKASETSDDTVKPE